MSEYGELAQAIVFRSDISTNISKQERALLNSVDASMIADTLMRIHYDNRLAPVPRNRAINAVLSIESLDKVSVLLEAIEENNEDWRSAYIMYLSNFDDDRAVNKLIEILVSHTDPDTRYAAAEALSKIGRDDTIPILMNVYENDKDTNWEGFPISEAALEAMQNIKHRRGDW